MSFASTFSRDEWFSNIYRDLLAGTVVALALIPEAIAFSAIAGVDPAVGLYASFCIAVVIAFTGGRRGMISAATGAMALLMVTLVKEHGLQYLFAATLLTGVFQIIAGVLKLGNYMRFVSRSVMTGFVNALAILIFMAQLPEFEGQGITMYAMVAAGLGIIYLFPYLTKKVPSPLVAIVVLSLVAYFFKFDLRTVKNLCGESGGLPSGLPQFFFPDVPWNLETLKIILPYSLPLAIVGLLESLMTASIVDDFTDTDSDKNRECRGQGIANIVAGCFGGMAGCAMIGQSVINVKAGGRSRLSTLWAGVFLLILLVFFGQWVERIPMAALVAVMIMVSIGTFSWASIRNMKHFPRSSSAVMLVTVGTTVFTHNLAWGVGAGVLLSAVFFAGKVAKLFKVSSRLEKGGEHRTYLVSGQIFFASANAFVESFDFREVLSKVTIDMSRAHFWDISGVGALDKVVLKFRREGTEVDLIGLNEANSNLVDQHAVHDKEGADDLMGGH
ncbi:SulP family inorganic anion transporter [Sulfuriroseicoccus oceanibius]|uniref:SulP family inorganic anion transporter n=1 Tax=Sulfuriroseicoccus oceanibius TaxID=2707525 RepID=A0A6B3L5U9_9BACT|nr:SulP family inorganic anion transporter [Sulfuriroseicoccus oceanibius]QQL44121.1 SulP family inorganic anion transporter [Sulfuriroseicoccus oceanibius]